MTTTAEATKPTTKKVSAKKETTKKKEAVSKTTKKKSVKEGTSSKSTKKTNKKKASTKREVIYPEVKVKLCSASTKFGSMKVELAKKLLGWEEETDVQFGKDYLVKDHEGKKVRCHANLNNRPFVKSNMELLKQEILRRRWQFNGDGPITIGKYGTVLNGQHTLVALVLATQQWRAEESHDVWDSEPTIDKLLVQGVEEDDAVINTIDTARPRSLADVIYRSAYFADFDQSDRIRLAKIAKDAINLLWGRTGISDDPFAPTRKTHSEALDFLDRHPKILDAVKHIYVEDGAESLISHYVSLGCAAGLLYLMAASKSDSQTYREDRSEDNLDMDLWDKAEDFWVLFAQGRQGVLGSIITALHRLQESEDGFIPQERQAIIIKGWLAHIEGKAVDGNAIRLKYETDDDDCRTLMESPTVGGIDVGLDFEGYEPEPTEDPENPEE